MQKLETNMNHLCIINLGLFRTGTTTLASAAERLGLKVFRAFSLFKDSSLRNLLSQPEAMVRHWWTERNGSMQFWEMVEQYNFLCDGWFALLIFLPHDELLKFYDEASNRNIQLFFVATMRDTSEIVKSELHHWIRYKLGQRSSFSFQDDCQLETKVASRVVAHSRAIRSFISAGRLKILPLKEAYTAWPQTLASCTFTESVWRDTLLAVGVQNSNHSLPIEGVLLTFRVGEVIESVMKNIHRLIKSIEVDSLCQYLLVIAIDHDESAKADEIVEHVKAHSRAIDVILLVNPPQTDPIFPICQVWHRMADAAWSGGASWVILLGDDVVIDCPIHYRAIYSKFLEISEDFKCPFGFGCPWFNDVTFPGFPTFPIIGKEHRRIFGGLIPKHRRQLFFNQDLDPYLQRLYLEFGASPLLKDVKLTNCFGGIKKDTRYNRIHAVGWRDWVLDDVVAIQDYLRTVSSKEVERKVLVDVVVPTYRLNVSYLEKICSLRVPQRWRTQFIVIVDNPSLLRQKVSNTQNLDNSSIDHTYLDIGTSQLEAHLHSKSLSTCVEGNNVRVRANQVNSGASASRNRGLDESAAEYVLFLDDDVIPEANLLEAYDSYLTGLRDDKSLLGLVGLVRFPRSPLLPWKHASVLMSYLTFMFEIASNPIYHEPAWGVTANLFVKRLPGLRFDTDYAKSGGGEDVDFCLRLGARGGYLKSAPKAIVSHPFWDGSIVSLFSHFFRWAVGDSGLYARFPSLVYRSFPNVTETLFLMLPSAFLWPTKYVSAIILVVTCDWVVDMLHLEEFRHRRAILEHNFPLWHTISAHIMANVYVIILEMGRLWGHLRRGQYSNITKRFDWHCGRLPQGRMKFRKKEFLKFTVFVAVLGILVSR